MAFYQKTNEGYILRVRLTPNSSFVKTGGIFNDAKDEAYLKISVISVPEKGKANKELLDFLAKKLDIAKTSLSVVWGQTDRFKKVCVITDKNLDDKLEELLK